MKHTLPLALLASLFLFATAAAAPLQDMEYQGEPRILGKDAPRVGEWVADVALRDTAGDEIRLSEVAGERGLVVVLRDPDCPVGKRYGPTLARLEPELERLGLGLAYLHVGDAADAARDAQTHGLGATYLVDPDGVLARELAASTSTETFVLDAARTLAYRGMLDDQYGLGFSKAAPTRTYLLDAATAVSAGERVAVPATEAQGCLLDLDDGPAIARELTYHNRVSRIFQQRCQTCHRPGAAGPFPLLEHGDIAKRKRMIKYVLDDGIMPPWFAEEGSGPWANDTSLTEDERRDVLAWLAGGTPAGDAGDAPLPRRWVDGWTIGEPDLVVPMPESFTVPADGVVDYQYFYVKTDLPEDRWVSAVEIRPGAAEVVHHVLVFLESPDVLEALEAGDAAAERRFQSGDDGFFASTVPGQSGVVFPAGTGKLLPAGSWLKFQLHYTPNGVEQVDRSEVGLVFTDERDVVEVQTTCAINDGFNIPAYSFEHEVTADYRFPEDAQLLSLFPHTHLRGMRFLYELVHPDGTTEDLLHLPFYDFNWQLNYEFATPLRVPAGTRLRATAWYDNTAENPANPDPSSAIFFGEQTWEEMMIGYVNWVPAGEADTEGRGQ